MTLTKYNKKAIDILLYIISFEMAFVMIELA